MSERDDDRTQGRDADELDLDSARENALQGWPNPPALDDPPGVPASRAPFEEPSPSARDDERDALPTWRASQGGDGDPSESPGDSSEAAWTVVDESAADEPGPVEAFDEEPASGSSLADAADDAPPPRFVDLHEHAPGELDIPPGVPVLEGEARGERRAVGIVVSRFNGDVTSRLLEGALAELEARGVPTGSITVMPVPGAFELPVAAMALAKTRRFACIVALGCVIRGDTPHFDYVASEAASGLQLASIETGVPVAFGVLTLDRQDQAEARYGKGAEAVRTALEMADLFANLRAAASR
jgi:6,7-dimethyl-8-ribityllumazine synthase